MLASMGLLFDVTYTIVLNGPIKLSTSLSTDITSLWAMKAGFFLFVAAIKNQL